MRDETFGAECIHGHLARKCELCSALEEAALVPVLMGALRRIAEHESRADRRHRGMVDASELADLQRIARATLAKVKGS